MNGDLTSLVITTHSTTKAASLPKRKSSSSLSSFNDSVSVLTFDFDDGYGSDAVSVSNSVTGRDRWQPLSCVPGHRQSSPPTCPTRPQRPVSPLDFTPVQPSREGGNRSVGSNGGNDPVSQYDVVAPNPNIMGQTTTEMPPLLRADAPRASTPARLTIRADKTPTIPSRRREIVFCRASSYSASRSATSETSDTSYTGNAPRASALHSVPANPKKMLTGATKFISGAWGKLQTKQQQQDNVVPRFGRGAWASLKQKATDLVRRTPNESPLPAEAPSGTASAVSTSAAPSPNKNNRFGSVVWGKVKDQLIGNSNDARRLNPHQQQYDFREEDEEPQQEVVFLTAEQECKSKDGTESSCDELQQIITGELQETLKMEQELQRQLEKQMIPHEARLQEQLELQMLPRKLEHREEERGSSIISLDNKVEPDDEKWLAPTEAGQQQQEGPQDQQELASRLDEVLRENRELKRRAEEETRLRENLALELTIERDAHQTCQAQLALASVMSVMRQRKLNQALKSAKAAAEAATVRAAEAVAQVSAHAVSNQPLPSLSKKKKSPSIETPTNELQPQVPTMTASTGCVAASDMPVLTLTHNEEPNHAPRRRYGGRRSSRHSFGLNARPLFRASTVCFTIPEIDFDDLTSSSEDEDEHADDEEDEEDLYEEDDTTCDNVDPDLLTELSRRPSLRELKDPELFIEDLRKDMEAMRRENEPESLSELPYEELQMEADTLEELRAMREVDVDEGTGRENDSGALLESPFNELSEIAEMTEQVEVMGCADSDEPLANEFPREDELRKDAEGMFQARRGSASSSTSSHSSSVISLHLSGHTFDLGTSLHSSQSSVLSHSTDFGASFSRLLEDDTTSDDDGMEDNLLPIEAFLPPEDKDMYAKYSSTKARTDAEAVTTVTIGC